MVNLRKVIPAPSSMAGGCGSQTPRAYWIPLEGLYKHIQDHPTPPHQFPDWEFAFPSSSGWSPCPWSRTTREKSLPWIPGSCWQISPLRELYTHSFGNVEFLIIWRVWGLFSLKCNHPYMKASEYQWRRKSKDVGYQFLFCANHHLPSPTPLQINKTKIGGIDLLPPFLKLTLRNLWNL
jgi:hypothetical protein